jgi:hypothetical protein
MEDAGKEKRRRGSADVDCGLWDEGPEPVSVMRLGRIFFRPDQSEKRLEKVSGESTVKVAAQSS